MFLPKRKKKITTGDRKCPTGIKKGLETSYCEMVERSTPPGEICKNRCPNV